VRAILSVPAETERSFWGRRYQVGGGTWKLRRAPVLSYPFLGLDELDTASPPTQRACLKLLQGETRVRGEEGELVGVAPTVVVLSNSSVSLIPPEYRRRSLTLDTRPLADQLDGLDLDHAAQCFLDHLRRSTTPSPVSDGAGLVQ
jgi:MoxR-like ATPase